ncbi:MAG: hypothetical protein HZC51_11280, partial [Nitrospirae bacterium]|nr:hypothetical protein [Nitrospirota bacterium]
MNIRGKLFLGFGLYVFLAATIGYFTYAELNAVNTRLTFLETADDVSITMLEVRRHEKNYLLYKSKESLPELRKYIVQLKHDIESIKSEIIDEIGADSYYQLKKTVAGYEGWVEKVVDNHVRQDREVEMVREAGRHVEEGLA